MCLRVSSFLYCMGLETGVNIIASLHLISALIMMIVCAYWANSFQEYLPTVENDDGLYTYWYRAAVVVAVLSSAHVLLALMLFVGIRMRRSRLLLVWVWTMSALSLGSLLWLFVRLIIDGPSSPTSGDRVLSTCEACAFYGLMVYFITCVGSYYRFLEDDKCSVEDVEDSEVTKPL